MFEELIFKHMNLQSAERGSPSLGLGNRRRIIRRDTAHFVVYGQSDTVFGEKALMEFVIR
jgi:hypothetical protein